MLNLGTLAVYAWAVANCKLAALTDGTAGAVGDTSCLRATNGLALVTFAFANVEVAIG